MTALKGNMKNSTRDHSLWTYGTPGTRQGRGSCHQVLSRELETWGHAFWLPGCVGVRMRKQKKRESKFGGTYSMSGCLYTGSFCLPDTTLDFIGMSTPEKNNPSKKEICSQRWPLHCHVPFVCPPSTLRSSPLPNLHSGLPLPAADLFQLRPPGWAHTCGSLSPGRLGQASWAPSLPFGFQEPYLFQPWPPLPGKCPGLSFPVDWVLGSGNSTLAYKVYFSH